MYFENEIIDNLDYKKNFFRRISKDVFQVLYFHTFRR